MSAEETVICHMTEEIVDALEAEKEDILISWIQTEDKIWQLCVQCNECDSWIQYPWVDHPCADMKTQFILVDEASVTQIIETSVNTLTKGLL